MNQSRTSQVATVVETEDWCVCANREEAGPGHREASSAVIDKGKKMTKALTSSFGCWLVTSRWSVLRQKKLCGYFSAVLSQVSAFTVRIASVTTVWRTIKSTYHVGEGRRGGEEGNVLSTTQLGGGEDGGDGDRESTLFSCG